jgi:hypothetical protein
MLQILRSLKPPGSASAPEEGTPPQRVDDAPGEAETPEEPAPSPAAAAPWQPSAGPRHARRTAGGRIELRLEEIGFFFFAAVVLVVLAFLMGWYGRGLTGATRPGGPSDGAPGTAPRLNIMPLSRPAARDLGVREGGIRTATSGSVHTYAILAARFPVGGEAEAEDHRKLLAERGYTPAWIRRTARSVELCVGRFDTHGDTLAIEWLPSIRRLHGAYAGAHMVKIPRE